MRSVQQKEAGKELARLEKIWYEQCAKNVAIDADIQRMQLEIANLEAEQGEKATDGEKGRKRKAEAEAPKEDEAPADKEPKETKASPSPRGKARNSKGSAEKAEPPESPAKKSPRKRTARASKGSK